MKHEAFVKGLTKILHKQNVIPKDEADALAKAFKGSGKPYFDDFLLDEGIIDKDELLLALAEFYQLPAFDVMDYFFKHSLLQMFTKNFLFNRAVIPIEIDENMLIMVASNPNDPELLPMIGTYVSYDIRFNIGIRQDIMDCVQEFYDKSPTGADFEEDLKQTREMRETNIRQEEDINELAYDDYEPDEK